MPQSKADAKPVTVNKARTEDLDSNPDRHILDFQDYHPTDSQHPTFREDKRVTNPEKKSSDKVPEILKADTLQNNRLSNIGMAKPNLVRGPVLPPVLKANNEETLPRTIIQGESTKPDFIKVTQKPLLEPVKMEINSVDNMGSKETKTSIKIEDRLKFPSAEHTQQPIKKPVVQISTLVLPEDQKPKHLAKPQVKDETSQLIELPQDFLTDPISEVSKTHPKKNIIEKESGYKPNQRLNVSSNNRDQIDEEDVFGGTSDPV